MKLDEIQNEWESDSPIKKENLVEEAENVQKLHSKYYKIFIEVKREYSKKEITKVALNRELHKYYLGHSNEDDLATLGKSQWQRDPIRAENARNQAVNSDSKMLNLEHKYNEVELKLEYLTDIIRQINARNYAIKNVIDALKWQNGQT